MMLSNIQVNLVEDSLFRNNNASNKGGAYYISSSTLVVSDTDFVSNTTSTTGGVLNSCSSQVTISGAEMLAGPMDSLCTSYNDDIACYEMFIELMCPMYIFSA